MRTLYLFYRCPMAHRVTIALQEKKLAFEPAFFKLGKRPPELEALGPNAKSPTLFDDEVRVFDSQIVMEYLEDRYPEPSLRPADARARAEMRMLALQTQELLTLFGPIIPELHKPESARDTAKIERAMAAFVEALRIWDRRLEGREFLVGDGLSLADILLFTPLHGAVRDINVTVPKDMPHLSAWHDRMGGRPSTKTLEPPR